MNSKLRTQLIATILVVVAGIIIFLLLATRGPLPIVPLIIWAGVAIFMAANTISLYVRERRK